MLLLILSQPFHSLQFRETSEFSWKSKIENEDSSCSGVDVDVIVRAGLPVQGQVKCTCTRTSVSYLHATSSNLIHVLLTMNYGHLLKDQRIPSMLQGDSNMCTCRQYSFYLQTFVLCILH